MHFRALAVASGAILCLGSSAQADLIVDLGGGWQATIFNEAQVDLVVDFVSIEQDVIVLQKFANFIDVDPFTGLPAPLSIAFTQIASDAETVSHIVFTDMFLFNTTGVNWTGFREILLGSDATFDPVASADYSIDPFTTTSFNADNTEVLFSGGTVLDGMSWTPGSAAGALVIDVDLSGAAPALFVLKELPIPAPGALALLGLGLLGPRRRRRAN